MGQLFTRMATVWFDQQTSSLITQNRFESFVTIQRIVTKRKRIDQDNPSNKRRIVNNSRANDYDNSNRLSLSSRVSPTITESSNGMNTSITYRSLSLMTFFKCQLCRQCFITKDYYLDHMILCAAERQASIRIVRAKKVIQFNNEE